MKKIIILIYSFVIQFCLPFHSVAQSSNSISIGNQVWMTKELDADKFRNGDPIPEAKSKEEWNNAGKNKQPAWCYYIQPSKGWSKKDLESYSGFGTKLYNWYAVIDPRGIAPNGWKIPSKEDFENLTSYLTNGEKIYGRIPSEKICNKLKSKVGWGKGVGTNETAFSAIPLGYRAGIPSDNLVGCIPGWIYLQNERVLYWTSSSFEEKDYFDAYGTEYKNGWNACNFVIDGTYAEVRTAFKECGLPIRCIVDDNSNNLITQNQSNHTNSITQAKNDISYKSLNIGNQIWMNKNLNFDKFRNGDPIPEAKSKEEWINAGIKKLPVWCYYENEKKNGEIYGKLYNWYAVIDTRQIAPTGWHVPDENEWRNLVSYLGSENICGKLLKKDTGWGWLGHGIVNNGKEMYRKGNGDNSFGFSALPGGRRDSKCDIKDSEQGFNAIEYMGFWWSSTPFVTGTAAFCIRLNAENDIIKFNNINNNSGYSVRCINDASTPNAPKSIAVKSNAVITNLTNSSQTNQNENNKTKKRNTQNCNLTFSKPKINFTLVDNRKLCRCCNERYAMYELNDLNKDKATAETFYLETLLKKHFEDTNADEAHQENDRARLNSYILENYGLIGSLNNLMTPILNQLGNLMLGEGKLSNHILTRERNIDKYVNKSDYCSRKCEILCSQ